jgi:outer membrane murein-binding lipoprotein Lpp
MKGSAMKRFQGLLVLMAVFMLAGCSSEIDENKPMETVRVEASKMKPEALKAKVAQYEALIAEKTAGIDGIKQQLKDLTISELMGEKAKTLKEEMSGLTASFEKLSDQMAVFAKELAAAQ